MHWCTVLSAQRLSGPVEHDKASESRSSLAQGANRDMDSRFQNVPVWAEKPCDSPVTEQSVVEDLHSEGYTKARSLGLTVCLTAGLEKLNLTAKYCGPEQACTVGCNRRSWVTAFALPDSNLLGSVVVVGVNGCFWLQLEIK